MQLSATILCIFFLLDLLNLFLAIKDYARDTTRQNILVWIHCERQRAKGTSCSYIRHFQGWSSNSDSSRSIAEQGQTRRWPTRTDCSLSSGKEEKDERWAEHLVSAVVGDVWHDLSREIYSIALCTDLQWSCNHRGGQGFQFSSLALALQCLPVCRRGALLSPKIWRGLQAIPENREFKKWKFSFFRSKTCIGDKFWHICSHL